MGGVCGANGNVSGTNGVCTPNGTDQDNLTTSDNGTQGVKPDGYSSNSGTFDWTKIAGGAVAFTAVATLIYMAKRYVNKLATPTVGQEGPTSKGPRDISKDDLYKKLETSTSGEVHFQGDTVSIDGEIYKVPDGFYQRYISQSLQGRAAANVPDNADSSRMAPPPDFGNSSDMGLVEKWNLVETDTCSLDTIEIAGRTFLVPNNLKGLIGSGMNGDNVYSTWADFDRAATAVQWSTSGDVTSTVFTALSSDSRMSTDGAIISGEVDESASWFKGASPTFNDGRSPLVDTNGELYDVAAPNYTATAMLDGQLVDIADYPDLEEGAVYETFPFEGGVAYEKVGMAYTAADLPGANNSAYEQFLLEHNLTDKSSITEVLDTLGKDHTALLTNPRLGRIYSDLRKMNNDTRVRGYAPDEQRGLVRKLVEERLTAPNGNWRSWEDIDIDFHREVVTPKETSLWDSGERTRVIRRSAEQKIEEEKKSSDLIDEVEEK